VALKIKNDELKIALEVSGVFNQAVQEIQKDLPGNALDTGVNRVANRASFLPQYLTHSLGGLSARSK